MPCVQLMTLMLQLLFEPHFKQIFTVVILGHYSQLMEEWSVKPPEAVMPLDMITVQLFNDEVRNSVAQTVLRSSKSCLQSLCCQVLQ